MVFLVNINGRYAEIIRSNSLKMAVKELFVKNKKLGILKCQEIFRKIGGNTTFSNIEEKENYGDYYSEEISITESNFFYEKVDMLNYGESECRRFVEVVAIAINDND